VRRHKLRSWKAVVLLAVGAVAITVWASGAGAASNARPVKLAIMTDCKGAFGFAYENDIGGAEAALAQYAHGVFKNKAKPSPA